MVLDTSLVNTQQYKVRIKGKVEQSKESSALSYPRCSSYWKGSLLVTLDYGNQLYFYLFLARKYIARSETIEMVSVKKKKERKKESVLLCMSDK